MWAELLNTFKRLTKCRDATIATSFAIALVPLTLAGGGAVDLSTAYGAKTRLQARLDSAVMAGVTQPTSQQIDVANRVMASEGEIPHSATTATVLFSTPSSGSFSGSAKLDVRMSFLGLAGIKTMQVAAVSTASLARPDGSCILTYGQGMASSDASLAFNGAPSVSLSGCGLRSNTSIDCHGHNGSAIASVAVGAASGCSNAATAPAVPDIYADLAKSITLQCGGSKVGASWSNTAKPGAGQMITVTKTGYTEYHVCGKLSLSGSGVLSGLAASTDNVIVVENGDIDVADKASVSAPRTAFVLAGANSASHAITYPQGKGKASSLAITPPSASGSPWLGVAIYQDPALTANVDITWGPGATLIADGLIYLSNSNVTMSGNGNSDNSKCTKFAVHTFTTNGNVNLNFEQTGCSTVGLKQWAGSPVLSQ